MCKILTVIILVVFAVLFKDILVRVPGFIVEVIDKIGHMSAKTIAIVILLIAIIWILFKNRK